jgi:hypothetical protein
MNWYLLKVRQTRNELESLKHVRVINTKKNFEVPVF